MVLVEEEMASTSSDIHNMRQVNQYLYVAKLDL